MPIPSPGTLLASTIIMKVKVGDGAPGCNLWAKYDVAWLLRVKRALASLDMGGKVAVLW